MQEEQIIAQAQQLVAARREQRNAPGGSIWASVLLGLILAILLAFLLYPTPLPQKLLLAMGGVCGLRPAHSYFAGDVQLPLEARMTGIYGGVSITATWLLLRRRLGATRVGIRAVLGLLALMFLSMVADGVNSTATDLGLSHPYTSTNLTRIVTGLLSGMSIAAVLAWAVAIKARPPVPQPGALFDRPQDLLPPLGLCALFGLLVVSQQPWVYYPVAVLSVGGLAFALAGALILPTIVISGRGERITAPDQLIVPGAVALLLALIILAALAVMRWSMIGPIA
jgi:uncharacterized membrane protein